MVSFILLNHKVWRFYLVHYLGEMYSQSKTPASIFSFDYKHMSVAPSLASGCGGEYVFQAWSQFSLHSGNYFELSGLKFRFQLKINFPRKSM